jgi:DNA invertase Pin-like site-specific DNA recombinase
LEKAIDEPGTGDVLMLAEWDRCTRSMFNGIHLIERINATGVLIKVLDKPHLDLTTPIGRGFIAFLGATAEDERRRIVRRGQRGPGRTEARHQVRAQAQAQRPSAGRGAQALSRW